MKGLRRWLLPAVALNTQAALGLVDKAIKTCSTACDAEYDQERATHGSTSRAGQLLRWILP